MTDTRPSHLVRPNTAGKLVALCGAKRDDKLPRVGEQHAQAHIDGRGMVPCPDCLDNPRQLTLEVAP